MDFLNKGSTLGFYLCAWRWYTGVHIGMNSGGREGYTPKTPNPSYGRYIGDISFGLPMMENQPEQKSGTLVHKGLGFRVSMRFC